MGVNIKEYVLHDKGVLRIRVCERDLLRNRFLPFHCSLPPFEARGSGIIPLRRPWYLIVKESTMQMELEVPFMS